MSSFVRAMTVFASPSAAAERQVMQRMLADLLDRDENVVSSRSYRATISLADVTRSSWFRMQHSAFDQAAAIYFT